MTPRRRAPEADATRDLYERYARQIHAYCLHQLGNREEAEDAVQSTFLNAFRGLKRGIDPEFESAWLYKIAENVCLTRQRSSFRRGRVESPGDLSAMQDVLAARELDNDELIGLPEALEEMPEQQRRALLLREWQGLSYKEIAEELDLSQGAVETLLFRARRSLASALTDEPTPKKAGVARKLRGGSDVGSLLALMKTLIFSGGVKVAATVATVAVTSVVAATPAVRHTVEQVVAPSHSQPAKPHAVAPKAVAPLRVTSSGLVASSAATSRPAAGEALAAKALHRIGRPAHVAGSSAGLLHVGHAPRTIVEGARVSSVAPAPALAPAPAPAASAPQPTPAPAAVTPVSASALASAPTPATVPAKSDSGSGSSTAPGQGPKDEAKKDDGKKDDAKKDDGKRVDLDLAPTAIVAPAASLAVSKTDDKTARQLETAPKHADRADTKAANDDAKRGRHEGRDDDKRARTSSSASPPSNVRSTPATTAATTTTAPATTTTVITTTPVPAATPPPRATPPDQGKKNLPPVPGPTLPATPAAPAVPAPPAPAPTVTTVATPPIAPTTTGGSADHGHGDHNHNDHAQEGHRK